mmetsp:Transcript_5947/g.8900  ORF Transcript_5947/g.8900 Transcript_5947/m.8900 type:complete len:178 (-) Transcript_5947:481-1014(-)
MSLSMSNDDHQNYKTNTGAAYNLLKTFKLKATGENFAAWKDKLKNLMEMENLESAFVREIVIDGVTETTNLLYSTTQMQRVSNFSEEEASAARPAEGDDSKEKKMNRKKRRVAYIYLSLSIDDAVHHLVRNSYNDPGVAFAAQGQRGLQSFVFYHLTSCLLVALKPAKEYSTIRTRS